MAKGLRAQLDEPWTNVFREEPLTLKKLETFLYDLYKSRELERPKIGYVGPLGDGLYRLPYGTLTGEGGWTAFTNQFKEITLEQILKTES